MRGWNGRSRRPYELDRGRRDGPLLLRLAQRQARAGEAVAGEVRRSVPARATAAVMRRSTPEKVPSAKANKKKATGASCRGRSGGRTCRDPPSRKREGCSLTRIAGESTATVSTVRPPSQPITSPLSRIAAPEARASRR
jgi:hypothetical protein